MRIPTRERSSELELERRHCPAAPAHAKLGSPREVTDALMNGKTTHAVLENIALNPGALAADVADAAVVAMVRDGLSFEGGKPEFPTIEQAITGRSWALRLLDKVPLPEATELRAEREVNLSPLGWKPVGPEECGRCEGEGRVGRRDREGVHLGEPCDSCDGSGQRWPVHWHQLIDLDYLAEEEDAYGNEVLVAGVRDYKGWNASDDWFETLQGKGYAVCAAALHPEADIIRRECVSYQMLCAWTDEIDLREEEGRDRLEDYRQDLKLAVEAGQERGTDIEALAIPGAGCFAGYDGCPAFRACKPAQRHLDALLLGFEGVAWQSIEDAARAFALASAARQEAASQLKGYGGGPIKTPSGHNVGWKDTSRPQGKVDENAPLWLAREYASMVLHDQGAVDKVAGMLKATGVGVNGAGVTVVRNVVARLQKAGLEDDDAEELLARCLKPKPGRKLDIWRGKLPAAEPEPPDDLMDQLKASIEAVEEKK